MEAVENDDVSTCIRRKISSSGKRKPHRPLICHNGKKARGSSEKDDTFQDDRHQWIQNSFLKNVRNVVSVSQKQLCDGGGDDCEEDPLNSSDFLMAQIDVDSLTNGKDCVGTKSSKQEICYRASDHGNGSNAVNRHSPSLLNQLNPKNQTHPADVGTNNLDSNKGCDINSFNAEDDLFDDGDDYFNEIFMVSQDRLFRASTSCDSACDQHIDDRKSIENKNRPLKGEGQGRDITPKKMNNGDILACDDTLRSHVSKETSSLLPPSSFHMMSNEDVKQTEPLSLKEKLKQRLQRNVGVSSPNRDVCWESKLKEEALNKARLDASQIRREGCPADIGPFYGLPSKVKKLFEDVKGISKLYDWQDECLRLPAVRERKNLIYTLPTSGGKTLVAEILILRELLCFQRDVLLILPFVSIVQEKVRGMAEFATSLDFLVEEYAGSRGRFPPVKRRKKKSLFMATIEKGHALVNSLIETGRMESLGLVVVDELHMLGEGGSRGATLESCLLKILHAKDNVDTQVIGMSATLNNLPDVQQFLQAEIYTNNFRPVVLEEYVKVEDNLFSVKSKALCPDEQLEHCRVTLFPYSSEVFNRDPDHLLGLVLEVIPDNSCLVFCPTKKNCENVALMLSELMCRHRRQLTQVNKEKRRSLLQELYRAGDRQLCPTLSYTIHFGIAYHHSGLTMDERRLIEEAYAQGILCLLTCTSTLAAGVNLPAKRVILRSPYVGQEFIKYSQYKQMTGRAGRAGLDASGESILIVKKQDRTMVKELLAGPKDFCHSSLLYEGGQGIQSLLLSAIGLGLVTTTESAFRLLNNSLLYIQRASLGVKVADECGSALQVLLDGGLVVQGREAGQITKDGDAEKGPLCLDVTPLGKATFKGCVNHRYSNQLYKDLQLAECSLVVSNHFHLLYLVTPYDMAAAITPVWGVYFKRFCQLPESELRVATMLGISENYLSRKSIGLSTRQKTPTMATTRFYLSLMLWDLWNGRTVWDVANRFVQSRGFVQNLLSSAASFSSCVYHFCQEMDEFWAYRDLLGNLVKKLSFCVTSELIPLMEVPGILAARAKQLYSAGIRSLADLAGANADDLANQIENLSKRNARQIVSAAKNLVEEKTAVLMEEVDTLISVTRNPP